jgi:DNA transformation protein
VAADELFFKVDDTNRREYETAGSVPFKPYADRAMTMPYYSVPLVVLEDATILGEWAARAVAVAETARSAKATKATKLAKTRKRAKTAKSRKGVRR